ncbi:MAG: hypothetical protein QF839_08390, partial [Candidatus Poseidoniaceae archaeon]|nr:hypothetical protein [Candidatus Poseidoniaceae archaeon]
MDVIEDVEDAEDARSRSPPPPPPPRHPLHCFFTFFNIVLRLLLARDDSEASPFDSIPRARTTTAHDASPTARHRASPSSSSSTTNDRDSIDRFDSSFDSLIRRSNDLERPLPIDDSTRLDRSIVSIS